LSAGNGTNPLRLAPCPVCITLHASGGGGGGLPPFDEVTCRVTDPDALLPGLGLITVTANIPGVAAVPVAESCVEETKVVVSGEPASVTCAPFTKLLPVTMIEMVPAGTDIGETLASTGTGFSSVTALCPEALELAILTACTVTEFGLGSVAGARDTPDALIVPVAIAPPLTPLTSQVTDVFDVPVTVAVKGCAWPARTFTGFGATETLIAGGGGGGGGGAPGLPPEPLVTPAQSA
jgi:hypothetical protein